MNLQKIKSERQKRATNIVTREKWCEIIVEMDDQ